MHSCSGSGRVGIEACGVGGDGFTKVKSFLVDFLAGIKICMYEAMCDNAKCSYMC